MLKLGERQWFGIVFHYASASPEFNFAERTRGEPRGCPIFARTAGERGVLNVGSS